MIYTGFHYNFNESYCEVHSINFRPLPNWSHTTCHSPLPTCNNIENYRSTIASVPSVALSA